MGKEAKRQMEKGKSDDAPQGRISGCAWGAGGRAKIVL
jgi:hypothetical protein